MASESPEAPEAWLRDIVSVLDRAIGLDPSSIGPEALGHSIRAAYQASGFLDPIAFVSAVQQDERHRQALIERVVVPETCFFRDRGPFELLARYASQWLRDHPSGTLRALSAPCASGEEAYSIAIALVDAGVPAERVSVEAVDVSERLLEHARRAIYQEPALRRCPLDIRERYFSPAEGGGMLVNEQVRRCVRFERRTLIGAAASVPSPAYDVVFCRNLLIYLHPSARQELQRLIDRCLAAGGVLIVGHAEVMPMCDSGTFAVFDSSAFALVRAAGAASVVPARRAVAPAPPDPRPLPPVPRPAPRPAMAAVAAADPFDQARRLADQGRLDEARAICERVIAERGPSDGTFFLLGVIDQAAGRLTESEEALRKALYLNPAHRDALLQLAVVHDRRGDREGAERLRRRAARADGAQKT